MQHYGFKVLWSDEDGGYIATCPDFPGLSAFGESEGVALSEGKAALRLFLESLQAEGKKAPQATTMQRKDGHHAKPPTVQRLPDDRGCNHTQQQAEAAAEAQKEVLNEVLDSTLATKADLREAEATIVKWIAGLMNRTNSGFNRTAEVVRTVHRPAVAG